MKDIKEIIRKVVEIPSNPSDEERMADFFREELKSNGYEIKRDNLGSIFGFKKSNRKDAKKLVIEAHMDDVGFLTEEVDERGFVKFVPKGGIIKKWMLGHKLRLLLDDGTYRDGIVIALSPHQVRKMDPRDRGSKMDDSTIENNIFVDFGFDSKEDALNKGFSVGQEIVWPPEFWSHEDRIFGKGFDNKLGVAIVYSLISKLSKLDLDYDLYIGGTTQEEVGLRGAKTSAQMIDADIAIIVDTSPATDVVKGEHNGVLGKGPFLRLFDRGFVTPNKTMNFLREVSSKEGIDMQPYVSQGGTNALEWSLQGEGTRIIQLGVVSRNIHNAVASASLSDVEDTIKMVEATVKNLDKF